MAKRGTYLKEKIGVVKTHPHAEYPYKGFPEQIGYNINLVARKDGRSEDFIGDINDFQTGLIITPPKGYFIEIFPSSELYKNGYQLLGPSVVGPGNDNELILSLHKFKDGEDIQLPIRGATIIVKKSYPILPSKKTNRSTTQVSYQPEFSQIITYNTETKQSRDISQLPKTNYMF